MMPSLLAIWTFGLIGLVIAVLLAFLLAWAEHRRKKL